MRCRMRFERDAVSAPALDVAPREMREPAPAIGNVPSIQPTGEIRDHEAHGRESHVPQHGERVVAEPAVGIVERDEELATAGAPVTANTRRELVERDTAPTGTGQGVYLRREPRRGEPRYAKLSATFDLVITQNGWDHGAVGSKARAVERYVGRRINQAPVLPKPPAPRALASSSVTSRSSGAS